ncbi:Epithelial splicing regulatory protein 2-like protein [Drosera capensis]
METKVHRALRPRRRLEKSVSGFEAHPLIQPPHTLPLWHCCERSETPTTCLFEYNTRMRLVSSIDGRLAKEKNQHHWFALYSPSFLGFFGSESIIMYGAYGPKGGIKMCHISNRNHGLGLVILTGRSWEGGVEDGYEVGSKRGRMTESNPYFAVNSGASRFQPYAYYGSSFRLSGLPIARLRGLPFNSTDMDILKFFVGFDIVDVLLVNRSGRFSGDAFVVFASTVQADMALQRNTQNMGPRYVEVFRCGKEEYYHAVAAEVNYEGAYYYEYCGSPPPAGRPRKDKDQLEYTEILKLRGLPYSVTKPDIIKFFVDFYLVEDKIHIARRPDGFSLLRAF